MQVNPGELNKRIEICKINQRNGDKTTIRRAWASVKNTTGTEVRKGEVELANVKTRFLVRYTDQEITNEMKVFYHGKVYNIVYVNDINESHEYLEIVAEFRGETYAF